MSLYKDASLVMIPSAYKDGKLYSIRPTDGDGDFTFSRGSNLAATRVDVNGLIEKGRENLLLQSNQFDTTWSSLNASETSGQSGYDGTNNAWAFTDNTATNIHALAQYGKWTTSVCTGSIYVKAGSLSKFYVSNGTSGIGAFFNLSTGSVEGVIGAVIDKSITSVGGGWYRLSVTMQSAGTFLIGTYETFVSGQYNSTINYTGTSSNIYIQDAQLEQGLVATDYIETGSETAQAGILEDMPRLDYSGGASCPSLLLEPQRSNLLENSEYLIEGSSGWTQEGSPDPTISLEEVTTPDGGSVAYKHTANATNSRLQNALGNLGADHTYSIFVKGTGVATRFRLRNNQGDDLRYDIDANGDFTYQGGSATSYDIEDYGNGWKRIWMVTTTSSSSTNFVQLYADSSGGSGSIYIWGAQAEAGSYPTSYIPTYGTSQTRSNDNMTTTFSSPLTSSGEVSVLFDIDGAYNSGSNSTGDNLAFIFSNDDRIIWNQNSNGFHRIEINVEGRTEFIYLTTSVDRVDRAKICIVVTASTYAMYVNGSLETSGSFTGTGNWTSSNQLSNSITEAIAVVPIEQLLYFPTALTSSEAIALTTL